MTFSVLNITRFICHADDLWCELANNIHKIMLCSDDFIDLLIGLW